MQASSILRNMKDKSVDKDFATTAFSCDLFVASFVTILLSALDVFLDFAPLLVNIIGVNSAPSTFSILSLMRALYLLLLWTSLVSGGFLRAFLPVRL